MVDAELLGALHELRRGGRSVGLVLVGTNAAPVASEGLQIFHVRGEEAWRDITHVALG